MVDESGVLISFDLYLLGFSDGRSSAVKSSNTVPGGCLGSVSCLTLSRESQSSGKFEVLEDGDFGVWAKSTTFLPGSAMWFFFVSSWAGRGSADMFVFLGV